MNPLPPPSLRTRILDEVRRQPSPTHAEWKRRVLLVASLGALASLALSVRLGLPSTRPAPILLSLALGGGLSALVATWIVAVRGTSMLGRSRATLTAVAALAPLALLAVATIVGGIGGGLVARGGTTQQHLTCFVITLLFALGPFAAIAYARRGSDPVHPRALGGAIGAAAGAWGGALIDVHCKVTTVEHLALGHALPIALLAVVGALLGARLLGVRAKR